MSSIKNNGEGFTAIELVVMLVVLAVAFTGFAGSYNTIQGITKKARDINVANQLAFAKVQAYENLAYTSLPTTTPTGSLIQVEDFSSALPTNLRAPRTGIVYVNTVSPTLKQIVVSIRYGSSDDQKVIDYADFIQKNGL
ncbi:MAG: hypothetical protein QFB86_00955 [Patescibacteria group bacterium]|nr:hypothetical protein [Patescibacteria group bacterium]